MTWGRSPPLSGLHQFPALHRAAAKAAEGSEFKGLEVAQAHVQQEVLRPVLAELKQLGPPDSALSWTE